MQTVASVTNHETYSPELLEYYAAQMETHGYFIIEDVLTAGELHTARTSLDQVFAREADIGPQRQWHTPL
jgi:hypothetical protein